MAGAGGLDEVVEEVGVGFVGQLVFANARGAAGVEVEPGQLWRGRGLDGRSRREGAGLGGRDSIGGGGSGGELRLFVLGGCGDGGGDLIDVLGGLLLFGFVGRILGFGGGLVGFDGVLLELVGGVAGIGGGFGVGRRERRGGGVDFAEIELEAVDGGVDAFEVDVLLLGSGMVTLRALKGPILGTKRKKKAPIWPLTPTWV